MRTICVVGQGYVGLSTATCFADLGNKVIGLDIDVTRIENLKKGKLPIYEPGLEEMVRRNVAAGRLEFTTDYDQAVPTAEFIFIAVGTPSGTDGEADLRYVPPKRLPVRSRATRSLSTKARCLSVLATS